MVAGSMAGITEHTIMYPIDTLKTHVQCDRCGKMARPGVSFGTEGCVHAMKSLVRTEGVLRLWRGVSTMFTGCVPAHAAYFSVFEEAKRRTGADLGGHRPLAAAASGALATLAHDSIMAPVDTVKQRLQLGYYRGVSDCVRSMVRSEGLRGLYVSFPTTLAMNLPFGAVDLFLSLSLSLTFSRCLLRACRARFLLTKKVRSEGLRGLYVSFPTTLAMNLPFGAVMVTANESFKRGLGGPDPAAYGMATHLAAGSAAGAVAALATTPLDMIKTRLQTQQLAPQAQSGLSPAAASAAAGGKGRNALTHAGPALRGQQIRGVGTAAAALEMEMAASQLEKLELHGTARVQLTGALDAARLIHREMGWAGFFRGAVPRLLVSAPSVAVSWTTYETAKSFLSDRL
eukprot:CAMPEP_0172649882 /NCGR_PEP_ID=MMETSP1068-20121228/242012_1 /TAXON_ID=35684 /ORGANISM="Pseudopedinella elastica, Strain CCMP716" /LENGTH=399 /DNA_ID=CAMNT_0013464243 /DNA_START=190 /DNA_END=1388 /DNA_ORIENTATION=+